MPNKTNDELINEVIASYPYYLKAGRIIEKRITDVMKKVDRALFIPSTVVIDGKSCQQDPYVNKPVGIDFRQTCSQPSMVAFMTDYLDLKPGLNVLEIGTGCGYSAAVTERLVHPRGRLTTIEIIEGLAEQGKKNVLSANSDLKERNIEFVVGNGFKGYKPNASYDRIYLTAGIGPDFNEDIFKEQLKEGGILIYPETAGYLYVFTLHNNHFIRQSFYGVAFVPLRRI